LLPSRMQPLSPHPAFWHHPAFCLHPAFSHPAFFHPAFQVSPARTSQAAEEAQRDISPGPSSAAGAG